MRDNLVVIIAQVTDTHVLERDEEQFLDNNASLASVIASLNAEVPRPDLVLATGDLTNWGRASQYAVLAELVAELDLPILALMGNHDDRDLTRQTFPDAPWVDADHASWTSLLGNTTLIGLDTTDPGRHGGVFDDERERWLEATLAAAPGPVILAMHHPPFTTGVDWMDASGFAGLVNLRRLIAGNREKIARILCGHFHRPVVTSVEDVATSVCLSSSFHVDLDLRPGGERALILDPRGYQLHIVNGSDVVSHTRYIDTGEARFEPLTI